MNLKYHVLILVLAYYVKIIYQVPTNYSGYLCICTSNTTFVFNEGQ